jgi:TolA-binding protein
MRLKSLLLVLMLNLVSLAWGQVASPQAPPSSTSGTQATSGEHHQKMMEMHKQHMEGMKADLEKMKASLEQMKANVAKISDPAEKARWQANVDMWQVMVGHMERMASTPAGEKKPQ